MEFIKQLEEAAGLVGMVISYVDDQFEDIAFVDWNTQSHHVDNMYTKALINDIHEHSNFDNFALYVKKRLHAKKLGDEYNDTPGSVHHIYGPFDNQSLSKLHDGYMYHIGYDPEKRGEEFFGKEQWKREREY